MRGVCLSVLLLISSLSGKAASVYGEISCGGCNDLSGMFVELSGNARAVQNLTRTALSSDGRFRVGNLEAGQYTLVVTDQNGNVVSRELVRVGEPGSRVDVQLNTPVKTVTDVPGSGTVSVRRLTHKPPKAARKAFEQAVRKTDECDSMAAISLLQKAVQLDPEYVEALNNLGARYIMAGEFERAIPFLIKAIELDPYSVHPYSNLSVALMATGDAQGAERAARQALKADPSERRARYLLGMSLFAQKKMTPETVETLRQTQDQFPRAQVALAMAEAATGETAQARETLKRYLDRKNPFMRAEAEQMLSNLETQLTAAAK